MFKDFKKFILRGNVVDLAVAVVVGAAFGAIVTGFVKDIVTPLIAAIGGQPNFSNLSFTIHKSIFKYGDFINSVISFLIIATAVFFFVVQPLNKLMAHLKPEEDVDEPSERECPYCKSAVSSEASRCKYCTSKIKPELAAKKR
jgi:large conductance mechanosensitive channel